MSDEPERTTSTQDGVFWVRTKILEHILAGSQFADLMADEAWLDEDGLVPLLAVCRDALDSQAVADELAYVLNHLGEDVIDGRRVYVLRRPEIGRVELYAKSATTDDVLLISPDPIEGVRVVERGVGAMRLPAETYVDGRLVPRDMT
jgi:hypothetical protein